MSKPGLAVINIHGREYRISSNDPEHTRKLASYCDDLMRKIEQGTGSTDYMQVMVLSLLQITHQLFQTNGDSAVKEVDSQLKDLIKEIDGSLADIAKLDEKKTA